jgi:hypothetical protein
MERTMEFHERRWAQFVLAVAAMAVAACGSSSGGGGETVLTGILVVPETGCAGCSNDGSFVRVQALRENGDPETIKCVRASPRGVYDTADVNVCPELSTTSFEAAADGQQTVIVVADVGSEREGGVPQIGGVLAAPIGTTKSKDFNGTTQIACVASVFLTLGNSDRSSGCVVQPTCPGSTVDGVPCFTTVDPNSIRDDQIENLESASAFVSDEITYPAGVPAAVCAVIVCTQAGAQPTTSDCVGGQL